MSDSYLRWTPALSLTRQLAASHGPGSQKSDIPLSSIIPGFRNKVNKVNVDIYVNSK